ncbi:skin secretory protein xP2-like [Gallus gallus]|uniref:skin secretory protein xP2-like n=1 Tax=Gallus gallus TaxID=9031 RepID=UPI001AE57797|nr:skin secretory protein xP2-like [Gallus gallus]
MGPFHRSTAPSPAALRAGGTGTRLLPHRGASDGPRQATPETRCPRRAAAVRGDPGGPRAGRGGGVEGPVPRPGRGPVPGRGPGMREPPPQRARAVHHGARPPISGRAAEILAAPDGAGQKSACSRGAPPRPAARSSRPPAAASAAGHAPFPAPASATARRPPPLPQRPAARGRAPRLGGPAMPRL